MKILIFTHTIFPLDLRKLWSISGNWFSQLIMYSSQLTCQRLPVHRSHSTMLTFHPLYLLSFLIKVTFKTLTLLPSFIDLLAVYRSPSTPTPILKHNHQWKIVARFHGHKIAEKSQGTGVVRRENFWLKIMGITFLLTFPTNFQERFYAVFFPPFFTFHVH